MTGQPAPEVRRAANGRPYIFDPDKGKEVTYTRASTFAKTLSDGDSLSWWKMERLVTGILADPGILAEGLVVASEGGELEKTVLSRIIAEGLERGGANDAAYWGTTIHGMTDFVDFTDTTLKRDQWDIPSEIWDALDAYSELTAAYIPVSGEKFVVCDELRCAGSYDRILQHIHNGRPNIADLKTGRIRFPDHRIQLAIYSRSKGYDIATGTRIGGPVDVVDPEVGLIVHLPHPRLGEEPDIKAVDLTRGWQEALLAQKVREARRTGKEPEATHDEQGAVNV